MKIERVTNHQDTEKNWTWLQTSKNKQTNNKQTYKTKVSLEYKTSSQHMKQRKTDAKRNIGHLHSSHIKGISCFFIYFARQFYFVSSMTSDANE